MNTHKNNSHRGQTVGEYAVLLCGILIASLAALTVFGDKTSDLWATGATILPGAQASDNGPIIAGSLIEHLEADTMGTLITIDLSLIESSSGSERLGLNLFGFPDGFDLPLLVVDS